jgi:hypothetical protein
VKLTVFAETPGTLPDEFCQRFVHDSGVLTAFLQ